VAANLSAQRWKNGTERPLEGVPFGVKDIIATREVRTTGGSALYADWVPNANATVVDRLQSAGAILVGKLRTFEFAGGADAITCNPWDLSRQAGGSSSGSGAAVGARELPLAIGTDTGGSIAIPAAFVGVTGLKPTYGRVPRTGVMPLSWTLDHVGCLTRSALDSALTLQVIAGHDPQDPNSSKKPVPDYMRTLGDGVEGLRIGIPSDWFFDICDPEVAAATLEATRELERAGAKLVRVDLPSTKTVHLRAIELTIMYAELSSLHSATFPRLEEYGADFQQLLVRSQFIHAADYLLCLRARNFVQRDFEKAFELADVVVVPGCVCHAPRHDHLIAQIGDRELPMQNVLTRTTAVFNIVGMPRMTVPSGFDRQGLPMAISIGSRPFDEVMCMRVAHAFQKLTNHHTLVPPLVQRGATSGEGGRHGDNR
jgi:aspartyl-tRNA(Asn)/glutamyl-tRNA(Gln) amidotransferase subunit A